MTSTGEKVPPADLEAAVETDPLFAQTLAVGDDRICIALVAVVNPDEWQRLCAELKLDPEDPKSLDSREAQQAALKRIKRLQLTSRITVFHVSSNLSANLGQLKTAC